MDRREFIGAGAAGAIAASGLLKPFEALAKDDGDGRLIISAPMLQNWAETSMGVAFAVSSMANGYVLVGEREDLSDARKVVCGGFRVTDANDRVMLVRLTGLKPSTRYYYRIGADRISYQGGYKMKKTGNEEDPTVYSFTTAGKGVPASFCVINDTHARMDTFGLATEKIAALAPSCVVWNGDATNVQETIESQVDIFLRPAIERKDYAANLPYIFCPGNHDCRGWAGRHLEKVMMFRQPEERASRDWDLGRNFAVRMGEVAMIGLDTAEDKLDSNPRFAGLFSSVAYREAQVEWLRDALCREEIVSAPYLVAFCHIPLFDDDPTHNPGDIAPADFDPRYTTDYALWQRTCAGLWGPLLHAAGCQLVVSAHQHKYRFLDADAEGGRCWAQIIGGSPELGLKGKHDGFAPDPTRFPTVIEGKVETGRLNITVHNLLTGAVQDRFSFAPRPL